MKTAVINIKTTPIIKARAQKVAKDLGFGLSSLINGFLNTLVKTKTVEFTALPKEEPSEYMIKSLREAENSPISPRFNNAKTAIAWLKDPNRKYAN